MAASSMAEASFPFECHTVRDQNGDLCAVVSDAVSARLAAQDLSSYRVESLQDARLSIEIDQLDALTATGQLMWRASADAPFEQGPILSLSVIDTGTIPESALRSLVIDLFNVSSNDLFQVLGH